MDNFVEKLCRLCLSTEGGLELLFPDGKSDLCDKIFECTRIVVSSISNPPSLICEICKSKLVICHQFIQQCIKANEKYQQNYQKMGNIEVEENKKNETDKELKNEEAKQEEVLELYEIVESAESDHSEELPVFSDTPTEEGINFEETNKDDEEENELQEISKNIKRPNLETIKIMEGGKIKYKIKCHICGTYQQNIKQHMLIHTGEKRFMCTLCNKEFAQLGNYNQHMLTHKDSKSFVCNECDKAFSTQKILKSHMITHSKEKNFSCEICGNFYKFSQSLVAHKKIHSDNGRPHGCSYCSKTFPNSHSLKKHIRTHTGEKPYHCDFPNCSKAFSTCGNLHTHRRSHTKPKLFKCEICSMKFSYKSVLKNHIKIHNQILDGKIN